MELAKIENGVFPGVDELLIPSDLKKIIKNTTTETLSSRGKSKPIPVSFDFSNVPDDIAATVIETVMPGYGNFFSWDPYDYDIFFVINGDEYHHSLFVDDAVVHALEKYNVKTGSSMAIARANLLNNILLTRCTSVKFGKMLNMVEETGYPGPADSVIRSLAHDGFITRSSRCADQMDRYYLSPIAFAFKSYMNSINTLPEDLNVRLYLAKEIVYMLGGDKRLFSIKRKPVEHEQRHARKQSAAPVKLIETPKEEPVKEVVKETKITKTVSKRGRKPKSVSMPVVTKKVIEWDPLDENEDIKVEVKPEVKAEVKSEKVDHIFDDTDLMSINSLFQLYIKARRKDISKAEKILKAIDEIVDM